MCTRTVWQVKHYCITYLHFEAHPCDVGLQLLQLLGLEGHMQARRHMQACSWRLSVITLTPSHSCGDQLALTAVWHDLSEI